MDLDALLKLATDAQGEEMKTQTGAPFQVKVENQKLFFLTGPSKRRRNDPVERHEQFVKRFYQYGSLSPSDYEDITKNATYLVALIRNIL